ncbi:putative Flavoprotein-like protein [Seiridium unicorne]|uniref:Flavoprotein-like protein n=1 Tax=Seiridium unicorne TaxID=138068 RepID=A0ABR2VEB2_9PEZI
MAFLSNSLTEDVKREQERLLWTDTIILQCPLWTYGMSAIMKSWVERAFSVGFGLGIGEHGNRHWGDGYEEGKLLERRAMLIVTSGSWKEHVSARGIAGPIDDILFPINHGILYYTGCDVLPFRKFRSYTDEVREKLRNISVTKPIACHPQNGGDYGIPTLTLKPGLEEPSTSGYGLYSHITKQAAGSEE